MKRIELIEDPEFKGTLEGIDENGVIISWDNTAPDGGSRWVRYSDVENTLKLIREIE
jgi:hypothetical protein